MIMVSFIPRVLFLILEGRKILVTDINAQASVTTNRQSSSGFEDKGPESRTVRYDLKSPPFFDWGIWTFIIVQPLVYIAMMLPRTESAAEFLKHGVISFCTFLFIAVIYRIVRRPFDYGPILLSPDKICMGKKTFFGSHCFPYSDISLVHCEEKRWHRKLYIATSKRTFIFELSAFPQDIKGSDFLTTFRAFANTSETGRSQLAFIDVNQRLLKKCDNRAPVFTWTLVGILLFVFAIETSLSGVFGQSTLEIMGGSVPVMIMQGELHRIFVANLLHLNSGHLMTNLLVLIILGVKVEKLMGATTTLMIFLASGVVATLGSSLLATHDLSVGSSHGILGMLGAFLMLNLQYYPRLAWRYRVSPLWWTTIICIMLLFTFFFEGVNYIGHVLGFCTGILLTGFLLLKDPALIFRTSASLGVRRSSLLLTLLYIVSIVVVITNIFIMYLM